MFYRFQGRRRGRVMAMEALYRHHQMAEDPEAVLEEILRRERAQPHEASLAREIVASYKANRHRITELLESALENWDLKRLMLLDRTILEVGLAELLGVPETPPQVAINEAVELAKIYSGEKSPGFVNGVLDALWKKLEAGPS